MKIQDAATRIISQWERGGRYDCHGNGAYGLIGWQGGQLTGLLGAYLRAGGKLKWNPSSYADLLDVQESELNEKANGSLMQQVQRGQARHYMTSAIKYQWHLHTLAMVFR